MRVVCYVFVIVLSALLSTAIPEAEMKQLTLADVNWEQQQRQEKPAVRLVRQLGFGRRFPARRGFGGGGFGGGGFGGGGGGFGGGGFGNRRRIFGQRRFGNLGFFQQQQPLRFFG